MKNNSILPVQILSTGIYLPGAPVLSSELEKKHNKETGWTDRHSGVRQRYWAGSGDTCTSMAVRALQNALDSAGLEYDDLDLVVSASASYDHPIPHNACLIQECFPSKRNIPGFDIDATCLGLIVALDVCSKLLDGRRYSRIAIVCSEIASMHLNPDDWETYSLLGDGAFACILGEADAAGQGLIHADMRTYAHASRYNIVGTGGNAYPFHLHPLDENRYFRMDGKKLLKLAYETVGPFFNSFFSSLPLDLDDVRWIIPHQASLPGLLLAEKILQLEEEKMIVNIRETGNTLSCSAGLALHQAIEDGKLRRGDRMMIVGTGAGFSIGGTLWQY